MSDIHRILISGILNNGLSWLVANLGEMADVLGVGH